MMRISSHASSGTEPGSLYRSMYAALAANLVEQGCFRHSIGVALCDWTAVEAWFGLGFGIDQVLGSRDLAQLSNPRPDLAVRRAEPTDVDALLRLSSEGLQYHAGSPMFAPPYIEPEPVRRDLIAAMGDPRRAIWVALHDGDLQGYMEITGIKRPSVNSARSETAITIGSAAVSPSARSHGVGTAILARVIDWARSEGCDRCTVEWTSANTISDPFWRSRGFRPLQYVLTRYIDERVAAPPERVR